VSPRQRRAALLSSCLVALWTIAPSAPWAASPVKLVATVGPGFTISLKRGGKTFSRLTAGDYLITVKDKATDHNFRLVGPGVNRASGVRQLATLTWRLTLRGGSYRFLCDPHPGTMRGSFVVAR